MNDRAQLAQEIEHACRELGLPMSARAILVAKAYGVNRIHERNGALLRAADLLDPSNKLTAWNRAERLADAIARYEAWTAPRIRSGAERALTPAEQEIQRALLSGARALKSQRRLYDLLMTFS